MKSSPFVCTKHINIFCGEKGEFLNVKTWRYIKYVEGIGEFLMCVKCLEKQRCEIHVEKEEISPKENEYRERKNKGQKKHKTGVGGEE